MRHLRPAPSRERLLRLSLSFAIAAALAAVTPAVPLAAQPASRARYLMGTVCEGTAYGDQAGPALDAAFDEIARLEGILSDYRDDSELSRFNHHAAPAPFPCSADLYDFLAVSARLSALTGGAFDPTVAPLIQVWDLRGSGRIPSDQELGDARRRVGMPLLTLDSASRSARFGRAGMALDPGAIGKGYALDAAARVLRARGVTTALLDFGGQVLALGAPPGAEAWTVEIAHPLHREQPALTLRLRDASASTSGNSARGVRAGGRLLGHIVDPRTGRPTETTGSVTVVAPGATEADALSTALLVMGAEEGLRWADGAPHVSAVFLMPGGTSGLRVASSRAFVNDNPAGMVRAGDQHHGGNR